MHFDLKDEQLDDMEQKPVVHFEVITSSPSFISIEAQRGESIITEQVQKLVVTQESWNYLLTDEGFLSFIVDQKETIFHSFEDLVDVFLESSGGVNFALFFHYEYWFWFHDKSQLSILVFILMTRNMQ